MLHSISGAVVFFFLLVVVFDFLKVMKSFPQPL